MYWRHSVRDVNEFFVVFLLQFIGDQTNWALIGGITGGAIVLLIVIIVLGVFLVSVKNKRATRGTYSPSRQEISGSRVEMDNILKLPNEERLI